MKIKEKSKITNILKIIVFTLILLILMLGFNTRANAKEFFTENVPLSSGRGIAWTDIVKKAYCSRKGYPTERYMDCSKRYIADLLGTGKRLSNYYTFGAVRSTKDNSVWDDTFTAATYDWYGNATTADIYGPFYKSSEFAARVSEFLADLSTIAHSWTGTSKYTPTSNGTVYSNDGNVAGLWYDGNNFAYDRVHDPSIGLPSKYWDGQPPLYSVDYQPKETLSGGSVQAATYIGTCADGNVSDTAKQEGLWGLGRKICV